MKKIFLLGLFIVSFLISFSQTQYPISQNLGAPKTLVSVKGGIKADSSLVIPTFPDTSSANISTYINQYPGSLIRVVDSLYMRDYQSSKWIRVGVDANVTNAYVSSQQITPYTFLLCRGNGSCDTINIATANMTMLVSGSAVWSGTGLVYDVTKCVYYILGNLYTSLATSVTLSPSDPSNPRIDVIYLDTAGNVGVYTGNPSPNPIKPVVNPVTQIELTHVYINAGSVTPPNVFNELVYNENLQVPTEWNTTSGDLQIDYAYTAFPYAGTYSAYCVQLLPGTENSFSFTNDVQVSADTISFLTFYLRLRGPLSGNSKGNAALAIVLEDNISGSPITNTLIVADGLYGFDANIIGQYQLISIPFTDFVISGGISTTTGFVGSPLFDQIKIQVIDVITDGCQIDLVNLQSGAALPPVVGDYWSLFGNDVSSFKETKLGTTSTDPLSIVTNDVERINIAADGLVTITDLQTYTSSDTITNKPVGVNANGELVKMDNWGAGEIYTENPIMATVRNDSNIIYFNADTAAAWRGGGGGGSGTVTSISQGYGISNSTNPIIATGTISVDTATLSGKYLLRNDTSNLVATKSNINLKVNISDTSAMLNPYLQKKDTLNFWNTYGNAATATSYLGTNNNTDLTLKRNGTQVAAFRPNGNHSFGLGTVGSITGSYNMSFGASDMSTITSGNRNIVFNNSVSFITTGSDNFFVGPLTGGATTSGSDNIGIGYASNANRFTTGSRTGRYNICIGALSGSAYGGLTSGHNNTFIGAWSGTNFTNTASNNIILGDSSEIEASVSPSANLATGDRNIIIGSNVNLTNRTLSNQLNIGNLIFGINLDGKYKTLSSGKIGIGVVTPTDKLHVVGTAKITDTLKLTSLQSKTDTTANKPLAIDASGNVVKMSYWTSGGGGGGGTVTSITQGYGITNSPNPIIATGTIIVDTATLSTKYVRISDTSAALSKYVPYVGATADVDLDTHILNAASIGVKGTNGAGHIDLRHQASDPTATGQTTALFADANGDLKYKNDNNYYTTLKTQQTADRIYTFQNKSYTLGDSTDIAARVKYTDTATMLTNYGLKNYNNLSVVLNNGNTATDKIIQLTASTTQAGFMSTKTSSSRGSLFNNKLLIEDLSGNGNYVFLDVDTATATKNPYLMINQASNNKESRLYSDLLRFKLLTNGAQYTITPTITTASRNITLPDNDGTVMLLGDTSTLSNRINTKASLSQSKYSFLANNTAATANMSSLPYKDTSGTYTGTPTWTGGTAPTTITNATYNWEQVGKMVTFRVSMIYTNSGTSNTRVQIPLPADAPTPISPTGFTSTSDILNWGNGYYGASATTYVASTSGAALTFLRGTATGSEIVVDRATSASGKYVWATVTYFTNTTY